MARLKITFTEDHIRLINAMRPVFNEETGMVSIDPKNLYGGSYLYEDMALILGKMDHAIPYTIDDPDGVRFDEETASYLKELDTFLMENLVSIEEILHQYAHEGIRAGVIYSSTKRGHIWQKEE